MARINTLAATAALAVATIATFGATLTAVPGEAEARGRHFARIAIVRPHVFHPRRLHRHVYIAAPVVVGGSCLWLRRKAVVTGNPYWWNRFHACRGW